jgi:pyruvate carboxylase
VAAAAGCAWFAVPEELEEAFKRCQSEARAAFGNGDVYVERFMPAARHVEVQILGDRSGKVTHLWERECTIQRRHQKLIEIAPSFGITPKVRARLIDAAIRLAETAKYDVLGTFEFLVNADGGDQAHFAFIEANARLQVEHTVTEQITGVDLVRAQLELASGRSIMDLDLAAAGDKEPHGCAIEMRINAETMAEDGSARPANGTVSVFEPPLGPGVRVDSFAYAGYTTNPRFDSLLAKLIVHSPTSRFADAVNKAYRALCKFHIEGIATNLGFLQGLLRHPDFVANRIHTGFVEERSIDLFASAE